MSSNMETQCDATNIVVSDIRTLILLLNTTEPGVCTSALGALTKFAESNVKRRIQLLNLGIVDAVLKLALSKDPQIKKNAAACLAATSEINAVHAELRKKEFMDTMIKLLDPSEPHDVQEEAAFAIANMCVDFTNKAGMRKNNGLKALINLLDSTDPDVKKQTAYAISIILDDFTNRPEVRFANGTARLLDLLNSDYVEIRENALNCLIKATEDYGNRVDFRRHNGLKRIIECLNTEAPTTHHLALLVMANALEDIETSNLLSDAGGIPILIKLANSEDARIKTNAELAIYASAKNERNQHYFREGGALQLLINNLAQPHPSVVSNAAKALSTLASNDMNQVELIKLNVLEHLSKGLSVETVEVKREVLAAISTCCTNVRLRARAKEHLGSIVKILEVSTDVPTIINAADCLINLAEDAGNRLEMIKQNAVKFFLEHLKLKDVKVHATCALALARCLQDPEGRASLAANQGIPKLIPLLSSPDALVGRNAAWAISTAAALESLAVEACGKGALEALMTSARNPSKAGFKFAMDALEKLLNFHPAAKYWLRNCLSSENQIQDGFYDMGSVGSYLQSIPMFPKLSELQALPVDKSREVIVIDGTKDPKFQEYVWAAKLGPDFAGNLSALVSILSASPSTPDQGTDVSRTGSAVPNDGRTLASGGSRRETKEMKEAREAREKEVRDAVLSGANLEGLTSATALNALNAYISSMKPMSKLETAQHVANLVCKSLGGAMDPEKVNECGYKIKIAELKLKHSSNTLPIGSIEVGIWYHRALLFKAIADRIGLSCGLVRGDFNRAWNTIEMGKDKVIQLYEATALPGEVEEMKKVLEGVTLGEDVTCIVDLVHNPGKIMVLGTKSAEGYTRVN